MLGNCLEFLYRIIDQNSVLLKRGRKVTFIVDIIGQVFVVDFCSRFVVDRISHVHDGVPWIYQQL